MSILFIIFIVAVFIQLFYYGYFFRRLAKYKEVKEVDEYKLPGVSVVVCAHNEEVNIQKYLHYILRQDYPKPFEVIMVDDGSTDGTQQVVNDLQQKYPYLIYVHNSKSKPGKKQALQLGIQHAKYKHLLLTDADCYPASNQWMKLMMGKYFDTETKIVLGFGAYTYEKETFLGFVVQHETAMTAMQYMSFALRGNAYMGVGRNLSYKKEIYDERYFKNYEHLVSGDDDLFIHQVADENNVAISLDKRSFTLSEAPHSWKVWYRQKVRHYSTGYEYKFKIKFLLGLFLLSKATFYALIIPLLIQPEYIHLVIITFFLFIWLQKRAVHPVYVKLGVPRIIINISAFIDVFWIFSTIFMGIISFFRGKSEWK